jgi:hypothetical protein
MFQTRRHKEKAVHKFFMILVHDLKERFMHKKLLDRIDCHFVADFSGSIRFIQVDSFCQTDFYKQVPSGA